MVDITSILEEAEPAESSVTLCLSGKLVARWERLAAQYRDARPSSTLGGEDGSREQLAQEMEALREQMLTKQVVFTLRALPPHAAAALNARRPVKTEGQSDEDAEAAWRGWLFEVVSACAVDPVMTPEQVELLYSKLSLRQWTELSGTAWGVCFDSARIPFSVNGFGPPRSFDEESRQPDPSTSPIPLSLADPLPAEPSSSETTLGDSLGGLPPRSRSGRTKTVNSSSL